MKKIYLLLFALTFLAACGDDDYDSYPPTFSAMTFANLSGAADDFRVGDRIVATAVQKKKGTLLYGSSYAWEIEPAEGVSHQRSYGGGVYDNAPQNPTDTIVFSAAGSYKVTLNAEYKPSGGKGLTGSYTEALDSGGSATYSVLGSGLFYYTVSLYGYIKVGRY